MSDVCIIVVTYNSRACFAELKAALEAQSKPFDLIVFDNASEAGQRPRDDDFPAGARIIQSETNLGFAAANNRCAALTDAAFIALLNPDAFPAPDWLAHLLDAAARYPDAAGFGSTQISARDPTYFDGLGDSYHVIGASWRGGHGAPRTAIAPREGYTFAACGAAALYRAAVWKALQGFDESLFCYGEDIDLAFRMRLRGWEIVQAAKATVRHVGGASASTRSGFETYHNTRNTLWIFLKNLPLGLLWLALPLHALKTSMHYAFSFFRAEGDAYRRGVHAALPGIAAALRARGAAQGTRTASVSRIARALTWSPFALLSRAPKIWR